METFASQKELLAKGANISSVPPKDKSLLLGLLNNTTLKLSIISRSSTTRRIR